jgi:hypothetical protein
VAAEFKESLPELVDPDTFLDAERQVDFVEEIEQESHLSEEVVRENFVEILEEFCMKF